MESEFLKHTPGWFLCKLNFESHCCKGWETKGLSGRFFLCLWHTEFLNVELWPGSTVTKDCLWCSSWGIWEGHEKDTTSARLISEKKSCKLVQNSLTSRFKLSLEGKAMAALGFCLCQRKRCVDGPRQILCLYLFYLIKDSAPSSCFTMVYPR